MITSTPGIETYTRYEREDGRVVQMTVLHPNFLCSTPELVIGIGTSEERETQNYHCFLSFSDVQAREIRKLLNSPSLPEESPEILMPLSALSADEMLILCDFLNRPDVQALLGVLCETVA